MVTREGGDAPCTSRFDFYAKEAAGRVGRNVKIPVAAEGDTVEPGAAALRRRKRGILSEYFERCGTGREFWDCRICAVRDVDRSLRIHSDVIAKCVSSRQRDAAFSIPCPKIKSLQRASGIAALCRGAQCTQVVRASPERVRRLVRENSQNRART